jgi:diguanylate cyclase (GGDEF)-like protein
MGKLAWIMGSPEAPSEPRWLAAVACFVMGVSVSALNLLITGPAVASGLAFALDAIASAVFLVFLLAFRDRLPEAFFQLVTVASTALITATIALNPRSTGNEAYYLLVALYVSYFFSRRQAAVQILIVLAAFGAVTALKVHDGSAGPRWLNFSGVLVVVSVVVLMLRAQLDRLIASLNRAALTDSLTGLLNRRAFEARIDEEAARAARSGSPLSMLALDIDHFKRINDRHGHPAGDAALASIAQAITAAVRQGDVVARVGGEEFSVLLIDTDLELASAVAERVRLAVRAGEHPEWGVLTVSVGVARLRCDAEEPPVALQVEADRLLYSAKAAGRDRVECALPGGEAPALGEPRPSGSAPADTGRRAARTQRGARGRRREPALR